MQKSLESTIPKRNGTQKVKDMVKDKTEKSFTRNSLMYCRFKVR